jgi:hypothetical protein
MGLRFTLKRTNNQVKFIRKYVNQRVIEKQALNDQFNRIDSQLQNDTIDKYTYEQLRDVLEIIFSSKEKNA